MSLHYALAAAGEDVDRVGSAAMSVGAENLPASARGSIPDAASAAVFFLDATPEALRELFDGFPGIADLADSALSIAAARASTIIHDYYRDVPYVCA